MCARPRSFSQLITSFFASESLGIPHTPLFCLLRLFFLLAKKIAFYFLNVSYPNMSMNFFLSE